MFIFNKMTIELHHYSLGWDPDCKESIEAKERLDEIGLPYNSIRDHNVVFPHLFSGLEDYVGIHRIFWFAAQYERNHEKQPTENAAS